MHLPARHAIRRRTNHPFVRAYKEHSGIHPARDREQAIQAPAGAKPQPQQSARRGLAGKQSRLHPRQSQASLSFELIQIRIFKPGLHPLTPLPYSIQQGGPVHRYGGHRPLKGRHDLLVETSAAPSGCFPQSFVHFRGQILDRNIHGSILELFWFPGKRIW